MCFCTGTTEYAPYDEPPPRVTTHTAYQRPTSRHSYRSYHRSSTGHIAALPPPSARRSYDHHYYHHRSSAHSLPAPVVSERRYVEYREPHHAVAHPARHSVQLVERRPRGVSRERVVMV
ncbi:hypothetical protein DIS24_g8514 [Lasiodiplodia hormozganensis]|uniref:Uncharacterized protein n=1 Tax=Lasiodiplodia hormozganensis TaxID=869390 RepID=A0AA39Y2R5_9PEZI|nr:hypothetical protein DIS24_g8514 [Lasiodiplodia hormozganensis]